MKRIIHYRKYTADEINDLLKLQFPEYNQSKNHLVMTDALFYKDIDTFEKLDTVPLKQIITDGKFRTEDIGLIMQDNSPWRIGLSVKTVNELAKEEIYTIGELRKAASEQGLLDNGWQEVFIFLATVEKLLKI